jgi:hypothetical protein
VSFERADSRGDVDCDLHRLVEAKGGAHPNGMKFRPPTTDKYPDDNEGYSYTFWEVEGLDRTDRPVPVASFAKYGSHKPYGHPIVPEDPMAVEPYR